MLLDGRSYLFYVTNGEYKVVVIQTPGIDPRYDRKVSNGLATGNVLNISTICYELSEDEQLTHIAIPAVVNNI